MNVEIKTTATEYDVKATARFESEDAARNFAAKFPKKYGVKVSVCTGYSEYGTSDDVHTVYVEAAIKSNRANGGANESGLLRYALFISNARDLGASVKHEMPYTNSLSENEVRDLLLGKPLAQVRETMFARMDQIHETAGFNR